MAALQNKTEQLTKLLLARKQAKAEATSHNHRPTRAPMSAQQRRVWLHEQQAEQPLYNLPLVLKLIGSLDVETLQNRLNRLVQNQESLRTVFKHEKGRFWQIIQPTGNVNIEIQRAQNNNALRIRQEIQKTITEAFNLEKCPLIRIKIIQTQAQEYLFILVIHHIISDGYSLKVIMEGLFQNKNLDENAHQYIDYSLEQQAFKESLEYERSLQSWQKKLENLPLLRFPTEFPRKAEREYWGKRVSLPLSAELIKRCSQVLPNHGTSLFQYCLSHFSLLLAHYSDQNDFALGIATLNRQTKNCEQLIGFFANTVPCRVQLDPSDNLQSFLNYMQTQLYEIFKNEDISFEDLAQHCQIERESGYPTLIQCLFTFREGLDEALEGQEFTVEYLDFHNEIALFDLLVTVTKTKMQYVISIDYNANLFTATTIKRLLKEYVALLENGLSHLQNRIETFLKLLPSSAIQLQENSSSSQVLKVATPTQRAIAVEETLLHLWQDVLKVKSLSPNDSFLALGGHSISAVILADKINEIFNIDLPIVRLFDRPTLALLAKEIEHLQSFPNERIVISPKPKDAPNVLSLSQEKIWRFHLLEPEVLSYNLGAITRIKGNLNETVLIAALTQLFDSHEAFHVRLHRGTENQATLSFETPTIPTALNYLHLSGEEKYAALDALKQKLCTTPYALAQGVQPWNFTLIQWDTEETVLLFGGHHLFFDGWSFNILIEDLVKLYQTHVSKKTLAGENYKIIYTDYAYWQKYQAKDLLQEQKTYWQKQLHHACNLEFPTDFPRPSVETYQGARIEVPLIESLQQKVKKTSIRYNTTPFTLYLSAFSLALAYFCGQDDFIFGIPFANRNISHLNRMVGHFVNVLPFRVKLDKASSLEAWIKSIHFTLLEAQANQNVFLDESQVRVIFNYLHLTQTRLNIDGLKIETEPLRPLGSKYDFSFTLEGREVDCLALLDYNKDLFLPETITFFYKLYDYFLNAIIEEKQETSLIHIFLKHHQSMEIKAQPLDHLKSPLRQFSSVYAAFIKQVEKVPDQIAICDFEHTLSYQELAEKIEIKATLLRKKAYPAGQAIGVATKEHPFEIISSIFAILSTGYCYIPGASEDGFLPTINRSNDNLAYVLYTSGSTGTSKGVMQTEQSILTHIANYSEQLGIRAKDRILQLAGFQFDAAVMDLYVALLNGCTLYVTDVNQLGFSSALEQIKNHSITIYHSTPSLFRQLFQHTEMSFSDIRLVVLGGEAVFPADVELFKKTFSESCCFINGYGPSECTIALQNKLKHADFPPPLATLPIGYPMPDTEVYLLDEAHNFNGLVGEIALVNPGLSKGYLDEPTLTEKAFINCPYSHKRLYLTGDLARRLPDGSFMFLGRRDGEIKIRGFKVNLSVIEALLKKHPAIENAAVTTELLPNHAVRLHSFYTLHPQKTVSVSELKLYLENKLPHYMIPDLFHNKEQFIYTESGKVNRRKLLASVKQTPSTSKLVSPIDPTEKSLFEIWHKVLQHNQFHLDQNFFESGGNSLLLLQLHQQIEIFTKKTISLSALFQHANIRSFALYLREGQSANTPQKKPKTQAEQRLKYLRQLQKKHIE